MDARPMEAAAQILTDEELKAAIGAALDSYNVLPDKPWNFLHHAISIEGQAISIFAFAGSHNMGDWVSNSEFKQCTASQEEALLPYFSGLDGCVHQGWATRLGAVLTSSSFKRELEDAVTSGKRIIFTGHSLGGAVATLAALMLLNRCARSSQ